jgi:hypothetical protein
MAAGSEKKGRTPKAPPERIARGLLGLAALTERIARPILGKRGFAAGQVIGRWPEIVGADLAAATAPERVQFDRGARTGGTLHLLVASGAAAVLIHPQTPIIIDRVNAFLGAGTISHIKVTQGPLPHRHTITSQQKATPLKEDDIAAANSKIGPLGSEPVRAALARLGARLKSRG